MNKLFLIILTIGLFSNCTKKALDKSIFDPLTVEEIRDQLKINSAFEKVYKPLEDLQESKFSSNTNRAKWGAITYNRLFNYSYLKSSSDFLENELIWENNWNVKYSIGLFKTDSIFSYWKKHIIKDETGHYSTYNNKGLTYEICDYFNSPNIYTKEVIKENILKSYYDNFISLYDYKIKREEEYLKNKDSLVWSFLNSK